MLTDITNILTEIIHHWGYFGILISTGLEYACFPISSEILLPFIGYSVAKTGLSLPFAILAATLGGIVGSFFCYWSGRFLSCFIQNTLCKKFPTLQCALDNASRFFNKHGNSSVLIGRVFPIVRTYISIPAGIAKMSQRLFLLYTGIGALVWNTILMGFGYFFGEHWGQIGSFISNNSILICIFIGLLVFVVYKLKHKK